MQAASEKTKRQTLQALTACFPIYGAAVCGEWAGRFSEALSIEVIPSIACDGKKADDTPQVFHATDNDTMELALATAQSLFRTLYPDVSPVEVPKLQTVDEDEEMPMEMTTGVQGIGVKVVQNSLEELKEPDKSNAKPAVRILAALIGASSESVVGTFEIRD
jgi:DNA repair/transcription protein MET18/MMS19